MNVVVVLPAPDAAAPFDIVGSHDADRDGSATAAAWGELAAGLAR